MLILTLTHATVRNPAILKVWQLPHKFFGRVSVWPKGRICSGRALRIVAEFQFVRYALCAGAFAVDCGGSCLEQDGVDHVSGAFADACVDLVG
jgi:hypothetical protein